MATREAQSKWRLTHRFVKRQLNVMAREHTHRLLDRFAETFDLRGKGEAVTFAAFVTEALMQRSEYSEDAKRLLDDVADAYRRDRDLYIN